MDPLGLICSVTRRMNNGAFCYIFERNQSLVFSSYHILTPPFSELIEVQERLLWYDFIYKTIHCHLGVILTFIQEGGQRYLFLLLSHFILGTSTRRIGFSGILL